MLFSSPTREVFTILSLFFLHPLTAHKGRNVDTIVCCKYAVYNAQRWAVLLRSFVYKVRDQLCTAGFVSDIAIFFVKRDVKLQLTNCTAG